MSERPVASQDLGSVDWDVLDDLGRRVEAIDHAYRAIAEKVGQLYIKADESGLTGVTELLDKPMRNASDNQQAFTALHDEIQMRRHQRKHVP